jgi:predicted flap endonuclease-1-like 5' DNA nuclease
MTFNPDDIIEWLSEQHQIEITRSEAETDVETLRTYGFDDRTIAETLLLKYDKGSELTLFDVAGLGEKRVATLVSNGVGTPSALLNTSVEQLARIDGVSRDSAKAHREAAQVATGESGLVNELAAESGGDPDAIQTAVEMLLAIGHPASDAKDGLKEVFSQTPTLIDACGVDARQAYFLHVAGYETPEDIADATTDELADVYYLGPTTATRAHDEAVELTSVSVDVPEPDDTDTQPTTGSSPVEDEGDNTEDTSSDGDSDTNTIEYPFDSDASDDQTDDGDDESGEVRLLVVGSARPNLEFGDHAGIRIRATLETQGYDISAFDAAIYTGFTPPTSFHERFDEDGVYNELLDQLGPLSSQLPVYYLPGNYGMGDPLDSVYEPTYAPTKRGEPFAFAPEETMTYVPIQGTVSLGPFELTQNPEIAAHRDPTILITPDFYPELWTEHAATAYFAGGQLTGRWSGDSLVPTFAVENTGPKQADCAGACHDVTIDETGIESHDVIPLDELETHTCDAHFDRGIQFAIPETGCIFCRNESRYFEELFRAGARQVRTDRAAGDVDAIIDAVESTAWLSEEQLAGFESYVRSTLRADQLGQAPAGPTIDAKRDPHSELLADPRDVLDRPVLTAHDELRIPPHERAAYFDRHDVQDAGTMYRTTTFEDVCPPATDEGGEQQRELDKEAYERGLLQGEWLIFPRARTVGPLWEFALEAVASGEFYDAQITTKWHRTARTQRTDRHALSIAIPNYFELEDAYRVVERIQSHDWFEKDEDMILFKPLLYSQVGISVWSREEYGLAETVRYRPWQLRKWTAE